MLRECTDRPNERRPNAITTTICEGSIDVPNDEFRCSLSIEACVHDFQMAN